MYLLDYNEYAAIARQAAADACVLLKNENETLPIKEGEVVSVFGRSQLNYYYCGTGSGGMVHAPYIVSIPEALRAQHKINEELSQVYDKWVEQNPFDPGRGWAQEPWSQKEMPLSREIVERAAKQSDIALVIIARLAGEDKDNSRTKGGYYLTSEEEQMLELVRGAFERVVVVVNAGNIIDMAWVEQHKPNAVLYAWQGGCEGGNGVADVLTGRVNPSGKLSDTIAYELSDYPSDSNFGGVIDNIYAEDIYVGYRYFETFAKERVQYPFGYGLSYTSFEYSVVSSNVSENCVTLEVKVINTGNKPGKQVVQVYSKPPQGKLGKPLRNLLTFGKTGLLEPGESTILRFNIEASALSSYDDSGITGHKSCYVREAGDYEILVGFDVRSAKCAAVYTQQQLTVDKQLDTALAPAKSFKRLKPRASDGLFTADYEDVPLRTETMTAHMNRERPEDTPYAGDLGYKLKDVCENKVTLDTFLSQLSDNALIEISRGEGMCSPKVTPGVAAAFGGVTDELLGFGIPIAACADGPSGIRMDCGTMAFSLPNGTALACTFDVELVEKLFEQLALELVRNKIDTILGPGMNIHRHPLCGRNFEYFSEDPVLSGVIAVAELKGMNKYGVTGTIKHFACNNQEFKRTQVNAIVSERALREIYLKGFEIAVKQGQAHIVMTSYNPLNGIWTAGNYELLTSVLRGEWGFSGIVMTDWWADMNDENGPASKQNTAAMIRAQNDLYMVTASSAENSNGDNSLEALQLGKITRGELLRNAANICTFIMSSPAMSGDSPMPLETIGEPKTRAEKRITVDCGTLEDSISMDISQVTAEKGSSVMFTLKIPEKGRYNIDLQMECNAPSLGQVSATVFINSIVARTISANGTCMVSEKISFDVFSSIHNYIELYFSESGFTVKRMVIEKQSNC